MEIRLAQKEDLKQLKVVWKLCFGDEDWYIDFYFENRNWVEETAVLLLDGMIVSMLAMIPVTVSEENREKHEASMLYAIATHPQFQKQGLADKLMEFANQYLLSKEVVATMLVPAEEPLFQFYEKRGYSGAFSLREVTLSRIEMEKSADSASYDCCFYPVEPADYNTTRRGILDGYCYVDYRVEEILFQKKECQLYQGDLFLIETEGVIGCAVIERISQETVMVKELLIPEKHLASAIKQILLMMPAETYILRTPAFFGETLGGSIRLFGMIRVNQEVGILETMNRETAGGGNDENQASSLIPYLGIAYD